MADLDTVQLGGHAGSDRYTGQRRLMTHQEATATGPVSSSARLMSFAAAARAGDYIDQTGTVQREKRTKSAVASLAGHLGGVITTLAASLLLASPAGADVFSVCPSGMSGVSTIDTSCAFADNVRWAWYSQSGSVVTAYSPVTSQTYTMQCAPATTTYWPEAKRCVGVNSSGAGLIVFVD
jgi:hypothetical protein